MSDSEPRTGVHRGKVNASMVIDLVEKELEELGLPAYNVQITGSMGGSGHKYRDTDIKTPLPPGLSREKQEAIERLIQDKTGADFYFEN